jgi:hypothetical protein
MKQFKSDFDQAIKLISDKKIQKIILITFVNI